MHRTQDSVRAAAAAGGDIERALQHMLDPEMNESVEAIPAHYSGNILIILWHDVPAGRGAPSRTSAVRNTSAGY